ncbi:MAG: restriction endonuclease subunit S [Kiritimatiellia bacterium]
MSIEGWKFSPLDQLLELLKSGGTPSTSQSGFYGGEIPFVSIEDMTACPKYLCYTKKSLTLEGVKNSTAWLVPEGCILYSIYATLGMPRINVIPVTTNQAILAMIVRRNLVSRDFLYYWLQNAKETIVNANLAQTTQKNLNATVVRSFAVYYPISIAEQFKIAEVLSTVDRAIDETEALIAKQQRIKTGLMQDLLTRGIDAEGNLRSEATHEFKDSPLGRIPVEWEVCRLGNVADFITSGSRGWARYYATEGAMFLRIGNLTRHHINMRFGDTVRVCPPASSEGKRTSLIPGDLVISITADLGIVGVIPDGFEEAYVNQHIALVRLILSQVAPRFIGWFLAGRSGQSQFEKLNESGAKAGLNLSSISDLFVPKMSLFEQNKIATIIDAATKKMFDFEERLTKLSSLKIALMQDLLSGKVRVTPLMKKKKDDVR